MQKLKQILGNLIGEKAFLKLSRFKMGIYNLILLVKSFYRDLRLFRKHSTVFKQDTFKKAETLIILKYHSLEKGLINPEIRHKFGRQNVVELMRLLRRNDVIANREKSQILAAYLALCQYYELHEESKIDISSYFTKADYDYFKALSELKTNSTKKHQLESYFDLTQSNFYDFSYSRCSVRDFSSAMIPIETIEKVVSLAKNAPSVCNRQPATVYYVDDKKDIDSIFAIQQGLKGYSEAISQLMVVVSDRSYFYTVGERNQLYIDGGLFLMNLLYALHYYKIGACPAHWGLNPDADEQIKKILGMSDSEKVICLVAIGVPKDSFTTALSLRRTTDEVLKKVSKA